MKTFFHVRLRKVRQLGWACLWSIPICLLLLNSPATAAPQDIDFGPAGDCTVANPLFDIDAFVGDSVNSSISVINSPDPNIDWSFDLPPTPVAPAPPCSGGPDSFTCSNSNVTIAIPPGVVALGDPGANAQVTSPNANPVGLYLFDLAAEEQAGNLQCIRPYRLDITEADLPFDLGFVLDRSGSMSLKDPTAPASRWVVLKDTVRHLAGNLVTFNQAHTSPVTNNVSLSLFATNVIGNTVLPANLTSISGFPTPPAANNLPEQVEAELDQAPGGLTAMGSGLKAALDDWGATLPVPVDASRARVVVLMTDGDQNQDPRINSDGRGFNDGTVINSAPNPLDPLDCMQPAQRNGLVRIITIGVGNPSGQLQTTLQNIATNSCGNYISTADGQAFSGIVNGVSWMGTISDAFQNAIAPALSGNSPLMVASYGGTLTDTPTSLPKFDINFNLKRLLIDFSFGQSFKRRELEQILKGVHIYKDSEDITDYFQPQITGEFTSWATLVTDFSLSNQEETLAQIPSEGRYLIKIVKPENVKDVNFQAFPIADDAHLDATWGISPVPPLVNQPFKILTDLTWRGQPIKDALVEAYILEPGQYVGDLLARNPLIVDLAKEQRDAGSPGYQKYLYLLENDPEFLKQLEFQPKKIQLKDQGNGTYAARHTIRMPGTGQIFIRVRAKDPELGTPIQRLLFQSIYTQVGDINLGASSITTRVDDGTVLINWRPITVGDLFVGPGNGDGITIAGAERTRIVDNQDGSYDMTIFGVNPDSRISISFLGKELYRGPASEFGQKPQSTCTTWFCRVREWITKFPRRNFNVQL